MWPIITGSCMIIIAVLICFINQAFACSVNQSIASSMPSLVNALVANARVGRCACCTDKKIKNGRKTKVNIQY